MLSFDEYAVAHWKRKWPGQAEWWRVTEMPVESNRAGGVSRVPGTILIYGWLKRRKGVVELLRAAAKSTLAVSVVVARRVDPEYKPAVEHAAEDARHTGVTMEISDEWIDETRLNQMIASASAVSVAYNRHVGMSRVLLEAANARTPLVSTHYGLVGKLVKDYSLGAVADVEDPGALAHAIDSVLGTDSDRVANALERFESRYDTTAHHRAVDFALASFSAVGEGKVLLLGPRRLDVQ